MSQKDAVPVWEWRNVADGPDGHATYYFIGGTVRIHMSSFAEAQNLANVIQIERLNVEIQVKKEISKQLSLLCDKLSRSNDVPHA
jgi:hypothetical protein